MTSQEIEAKQRQQRELQEELNRQVQEKARNKVRQVVCAAGTMMLLLLPLRGLVRYVTGDSPGVCSTIDTACSCQA